MATIKVEGPKNASVWGDLNQLVSGYADYAQAQARNQAYSEAQAAAADYDRQRTAMSQLEQNVINEALGNYRSQIATPQETPFPVKTTIPLTEAQQRANNDLYSLMAATAGGRASPTPFTMGNTGQIYSQVSGNIPGLSDAQQQQQQVTGLDQLLADVLKTEAETAKAQRPDASAWTTETVMLPDANGNVQPTLVRLNKVTGVQEPIGPAQPRSGMTVFDPATGEPLMTTGDPTELLGRKAQGTVETSAINTGKSLEKLKSLGPKIKPELFNVVQRGINDMANIYSRLGGDMGDKQRAYTKARETLFVPVRQIFNAYRKEITGAAAALAEIVRLEKAFLNENVSYEKFMATYNSIIEDFERDLQYYNEVLDGGVPANRNEEGLIETPAGWTPDGQATAEGAPEMPEIPTRMAGMSDEARYNQLKKAGLSDDQAYTVMAGE